MKKQMLTIMGFAMAYAFVTSPAFAGNEGVVTQTNGFNKGKIVQSGDNNNADINQASLSAGLGNENVAKIDQAGTGNGTPSDKVTIKQLGGANNDAFIRQLASVSNSDADIHQKGDANQAYIKQENGTNNAATINQGKSDVLDGAPSDSSLAIVFQDGNDHVATVNQNGGAPAPDSLQAFVSQTETGQTATVNQTGMDNLAIIEQGMGAVAPDASTILPTF